MKNKILIIDDNLYFVHETSVLLRANNYEVISADNGVDGFQKVKEESPDLILMDMTMSYKTEGAETAKIIAQDAAVKNIPIILMTEAQKDVSATAELKTNQPELSVKAILEKPFKPEALLHLAQIHITTSGKKHREDIREIEVLAEKWKGKKGNLIMILHEIQNHYGYVPRGISFELSRILDVPLARIYEVITFYHYFKLDPPGKHLISLCLGTACYLKGAPEILDEIKNILHVKEGQTTQDGLFHLQVVRCLGCCGLAPVMTIDGKTYGKLKRGDIMDILSQYSKEAQGAAIA
jgi:NADH-quinone oxidoreductase subunit E